MSSIERPYPSQDACSVLLYADESVRDWHDVDQLADSAVVHGVNVKMEKSGGWVCAART